MKYIRLDFPAHYRRVADKLTKRLRAVKLNPGLRASLGFKSTGPLLAMSWPTHSQTLAPDIIVVLWSTQPEDLDQQIAKLEPLIDSNAPVLPVLFEPLKTRSESGQRSLEKLLAKNDLLAIDLADEADGWEIGTLKIAARALSIPFNELRDREANRERQRIRFNRFATGGLLTILVLALILRQVAEVVQLAALQSMAGCLYFSATNMNELLRYSAAPGPAAPMAIGAMRTNLARSERFAAWLSVRPEFQSIGPAVSTYQRLMIASALIERDQFDEAIKILEEAKEESLAIQSNLYLLDPTGTLEGAKVKVETTMARVYYQAGQYEEALKRFETIAAAARNSSVEGVGKCDDLVQALIGIAFSKQMISKASGTEFSSQEMADARACIAQTNGKDFSQTASFPEEESELRRMLTLQIETSDLELARASGASLELLADRRRAAELAVSNFDTVTLAYWTGERMPLGEELSELRERTGKLRDKAFQNPQHAGNWTELSFALQRLARRWAEEGNNNGLEASFEAEAILNELERNDPTNLNYRSRRARLLASRAEGFAQLGSCQLAEEARQKSIKIYRTLIFAQKLSTVWQAELKALNSAKICDEAP